MLNRRFALLGLAALCVAACDAPDAASPEASNLIVRNITVDTSKITGVEGREIVVAPAQISKDLLSALRTSLAKAGTGNADIIVQVQQVELVSRGASVAFLQSNIKAILTVRDASTGQDIVPPTAITGFSEQFRLGGVVGVVTAPSAEQDYQQTLRGFANTVRDRVYGTDTAA